MARIMLIEDDAMMRDELRTMLEKAGYETLVLTEFAQAVQAILRAEPELVLLDLNLPEMSGFQICRELKGKNAVPVLVLTSRDTLQDELAALSLGADEYLTKPCRKERLLARIANVMKRYEGRQHLLEGDGFLLDAQIYTLYIHGQSVILPPNQGKLLAVFLAHAGETVLKDDLCLALWDTTAYIDENALQVNLTRLKKTMARFSMKQTIVAVRGIGYRMEERE